jgi:hypothetical protein
MADQGSGMASPYLEDEDVSTIVIKPLPKYARQALEQAYCSTHGSEKGSRK